MSCYFILCRVVLCYVVVCYVVVCYVVLCCRLVLWDVVCYVNRFISDNIDKI